MIPDIHPGASFPDFELPDQSGVKRKVSDLQGDDPLALMLARGGYCPKENWQHRWMAAMEPEIAVGYCRLVTISTDSVLASNEWRSRLGAHWPFLSDDGRAVQRDLDIVEYTDPKHNPMIPHTIFLKPGLVVHGFYNGYWYWGRPTPEELRQNFRDITRECRPDWDLSATGLRERWDAGDHGSFFPYGHPERHRTECE